MLVAFRSVSQPAQLSLDRYLICGGRSTDCPKDLASFENDGTIFPGTQQFRNVGMRAETLICSTFNFAAVAFLEFFQNSLMIDPVDNS